MNKVKITKDLCKKCNICAEYCPKKVFIIDEDENIIPQYTNKCVGCKLCELRCPDFALTVEVKVERNSSI